VVVSASVIRPPPDLEQELRTPNEVYPGDATSSSSAVRAYGRMTRTATLSGAHAAADSATDPPRAEPLRF
jgi:hypothetical protein